MIHIPFNMLGLLLHNFLGPLPRPAVSAPDVLQAGDYVRRYSRQLLTHVGNTEHP